MRMIRRTLVDPATYSGLLYLLSGAPLGLVWFVALVTVWSLCLGLAITPFVIPLVIGLSYMTRGFAAVEAELARSLLEVDANAPAAPPPASGLWARMRGMFAPDFWRAQAYLLIRWFVGFPVAIVVFSLLVAAVGMIFAPVWVPLVHGGTHLGIWRPHTFVQSLGLVPVGLVLLPASLLLVRLLAQSFAPVASGLLRPSVTSSDVDQPAGRIESAVARRRGLEVHATVDAAVLSGLVLIWAATSLGYFWPIWPMVGIAIIFGVLAAAVLPSSPGHAEMTERIETLESTRAGAVSLQDSELRRIERDLHDGAQARLVALGMSLGMAEQKLADDPERVGELIAEARAGAETALRELRDLARGIHPPVLADRGLEAALSSLASSTPIGVNVSVDLAERPTPTVESAAYFVAAEALANAAKHAQAKRVDIRITDAGDILELAVEDDGTGGANPNGTGLLGMRRRVEALDGSLSVTSPPGGPTIIRAELPCGS